MAPAESSSTPLDPDEAPLRLYETEVLPEWVDYNGHMSEAFYVLVFGYTTDALLDYIGMDSEYRERNRCSMYTLEAHVSYLREAAEGEPLLVTTQLLEVDHKRVHLFHSMHHAADGRLLATGEVMLLHVVHRYESDPRSAPFAEEISVRLRQIEAAHGNLGRPDQAGRSVGIKR